MFSRSRHHRLAAVAVGSGILVAVSLFGVRPVPAASSAFEGSAGAAGFRLLFAVANAPVQQTVIDSGGPTAHATVNSVGSSTSLSSFPYPGDLFLAAPGLARGAFGVPAPEYPFFVRADHPQTPEAEASFGFTHLEAAAKDGDARAQATSGASGTDGFAITHSKSTSSVSGQNETVVASAESLVEGVVIGPLRIGTLRSVARVIRHPDGEVERVSDLALENATVAGAPATFGPDGRLETEGELSSARSIGPAAPLDALSQAGIEVVQLNKEETDDGVVSAGLRISRRGDFGPGNPGVLSLIMGQSSARVQGGGTDVLDDLGGSEGLGSTDSSASGSSGLPSEANGSFGDPSTAFSAPDDQGIPSDAMVLDTASGDTSGSAVPAGQGETDVGTAAFAPARPATALPAAAPARFRVAERFDSGPLFLLLLLGAVLAAGSAPIIRLATRR